MKRASVAAVTAGAFLIWGFVTMGAPEALADTSCGTWTINTGREVTDITFYSNGDVKTTNGRGGNVSDRLSWSLGNYDYRIISGNGDTMSGTWTQASDDTGNWTASLTSSAGC